MPCENFSPSRGYQKEIKKGHAPGGGGGGGGGGHSGTEGGRTLVTYFAKKGSF